MAITSEIEAILRSKWTRWAADVAGKDYGFATAADLEAFLDDPKSKITQKDVDDLVAEL